MNLRQECSSTLLLYVAGLPSKATPEEIEEFFSQLGSYRLLRLRSSKKGIRVMGANPLNNIRRGFCVLEAQNLQSYSTLLSIAGLLFKRRKLAITKLRNKDEYFEYTADQAKKKIVLSDVPKMVSSQTILEQLELSFGRVRKLTHHKEKVFLEKQQNFCSNTFLVEFLFEESVQEALGIGCITFYWRERCFTAHVNKYQFSTDLFEDNSQADNWSSKTLKNFLEIDTSWNFRQIYEKSKEIDCFDICNGNTNMQFRSQVDINSERHFSKPTARKYHHKMNTCSIEQLHRGSVAAVPFPLRFNVMLGK